MSHPFDGLNICVLDLETLHSADDLPTRWDDKRALGLSIGGYYDYLDQRIYWFDQHTLFETMNRLRQRKPLIVSFNGIGFDGPLMLEVLQEIGTKGGMSASVLETYFAYDWHALWANSYDILAEVWRADDANKFARGLNSLDALCAANNLGQKTGDGARAPRLWQAGQIAEVINYCQQDILLTKALFEYVCANNGTIQRATGPLTIRLPHFDTSGV